MAIAAFLIVGAIAGGATLVRSIIDEPRSEPSKPVEEVKPDDWNGAIVNAYPEIARGTYGNREWLLEGKRATLGKGIHKVVLRFLMESRGEPDVARPVSATTEVLPSDDPMIAREAASGDGSARVVFGAVLDSVHSVEAVLNNGSRESALIFTGYDSRSTISAQYFVMFLPPQASGYLFARDYLGVDYDREPIGDAPKLDWDEAPFISGSFDAMPWHVFAERSDTEICFDLGFVGGESFRRCFEDVGYEGGEGLLMEEVDLQQGAKALVGVQPLAYSNLQIAIDDRTLPLQVADAHETLGFPFAVVVGAGDHGTISAAIADEVFMVEF